LLQFIACWVLLSVYLLCLFVELFFWKFCTIICDELACFFGTDCWVLLSVYLLCLFIELFSENSVLLFMMSLHVFLVQIVDRLHWYVEPGDTVCFLSGSQHWLCPPQKQCSCSNFKMLNICDSMSCNIGCACPLFYRLQLSHYNYVCCDKW
jgi:hypothetical protein